MTTRTETTDAPAGAGGAEGTTRTDLRDRLLSGVPVIERRAVLAGIPTAFLEGGTGTGGRSGAPLVLLHGPGESAVNWRWVLPELVERHRVVAPDLPAHGGSGGEDEELDESRVLAWLGELVEACGREPPVLVGHLLGGALAARYAAAGGRSLGGLVLVDALGLASFRPSLRFLLTMLGFQIRPTADSFRRFMGQCAYDRDVLQERMGERWDAFVAHAVAFARSTKSKAAGRLLRTLGLPRIPPEALDRIAVPTALVWGRHDRALPLRIAEDAAERYGWPLHVVEEAADDPARDRPEAFVRALEAALDGFRTGTLGFGAHGGGRDLPLPHRRRGGAGDG